MGDLVYRQDGQLVLETPPIATLHVCSAYVHPVLSPQMLQGKCTTSLQNCRATHLARSSGSRSGGLRMVKA